jgi:hypothetical protein
MMLGVGSLQAAIDAFPISSCLLVLRLKLHTIPDPLGEAAW